MNECLLTMIATPEYEEALVDWLLESGHGGFTTSACHGHGIHSARLSSAEQVAGRQRRIAFWIQTTEPKAREIIEGVAVRFGDAGLHYWIMPVSAAGPITNTQRAPADPA